MKNLDKNTKIPLARSPEKINGAGHPESNNIIRDEKVLRPKKAEKTYKVTISYIQLTDEEAKNKRGIIESILRKRYKK